MGSNRRQAASSISYVQDASLQGRGSPQEQLPDLFLSLLCSVTASFEVPAGDSPATPWLPFLPAALCSEKQICSNLIVEEFYSITDN